MRTCRHQTGIAVDVPELAAIWLSQCAKGDCADDRTHSDLVQAKSLNPAPDARPSDLPGSQRIARLQALRGRRIQHPRKPGRSRIRTRPQPTQKAATAFLIQSGAKNGLCRSKRFNTKSLPPGLPAPRLPTAPPRPQAPVPSARHAHPLAAARRPVRPSRKPQSRRHRPRRYRVMKKCWFGGIVYPSGPANCIRASGWFSADTAPSEP